MLGKCPELKLHCEVAEAVKIWGDRLQSAFFSKVPESCLLKIRDALDPALFGVLTPEMLNSRLMTKEDVCILCGVSCCPCLEQISWRKLRILKVCFLKMIFPNPLALFLRKINDDKHAITNEEPNPTS